MMRFAVSTLLALLAFGFSFGQISLAQAPSPAASMVRLLESGRVPADRQGTIVKLICDRGNSEDLTTVFNLAAEPGHWPDSLRKDAFSQLLDASRNRDVQPEGDLSAVAKLAEDNDPELRGLGLALIAEWNVVAAAPALEQLALNEQEATPLRQEALQALAKIDGERAQSTIKALASAEKSAAERSLAISVWAPINAKAAAEAAANYLQQLSDREDPAAVLDAFLSVQGGSEVLAKRLQETPPSEDVARLLLRRMYAIGRTDAELNDVLSSLAKVSPSLSNPTKEDIEKLAAEVREQGDAHRGETVFRRDDLSCMRCHAVSKAGGQIGPDLSAVGSTSPVDYLIESVLKPDQAIKEGFLTRVVLTTEGRIHQGLVSDRTEETLVLRDADGKLTSIPTADIDDELEGKSLMPKGLVNFMTRAELVDLIAFLSELGKPGDFAVRSNQRLQRYRVLTTFPESLAEQVPTPDQFEDLILGSSSWQPVYARVNGELPLSELAAQTEQSTLYILGEVDCSSAGKAMLKLDSSEGIVGWWDETPLNVEDQTLIRLTPGRHKLVLRVETPVRESDSLKVEFERTPDSKAEFFVVDGM